MKTVQEFLDSLTLEQYQDLCVFLIESGHGTLVQRMHERCAQIDRYRALFNQGQSITEALTNVSIECKVSEKTLRRAMDWLKSPLRLSIYEDFIRSCDERIAAIGE